MKTLAFRKWKRQSFTLVEMLAVLFIAGLLAGISIGAYQQMMKGTAVDAGARMLASQLNLARSYAVTSRSRVALLLPAAGELNSTFQNYRASSMRACIVDSSNTFVRYVKGTTWGFLPTSAYIPTFSGSIQISNVPFPNTGSGTFFRVRAVIFKPTGSLTTATDVGPIYVKQMTLAGTTLTAQAGGSNEIGATINWLTGKANFQ